MQPYIESFLPLFVAMNLPGVLPIFISMTEGMTTAARRRLVIQAISTAFALAVVILFAGEFIFATLGITLNDLRVGGGIILLVLSISDLLFGDFKRRGPEDGTGTVGVVPIGIPLIIGPAAITTILVSQQGFGYVPTLVSLVANLVLVGIGFLVGPTLIARFGNAFAKAIAKVASLFLAAIAVAMIRAGIMGFIAG